MSAHVPENVLVDLRSGKLSPPEIVRALRHIQACEECAAATQDGVGRDAARIRALLIDDASEPPRHLTPEELSAWVDGTLDAAAREAAQGHLDECELCREDVADLERFRRPAAPRWWIWLAAAAVLAMFAAPLLRSPGVTETIAPTPAVTTSQTVPSEPPPARYANAQWQQLIDDALASGRLPLPDLAQLRGTPTAVRGGSAASELRPAGVVIDEERPTLTWPPIEGATYVVSVYDRNEEVARSAPLRHASWKPDRTLRRNHTYTWQVEARTQRDMIVLPSPPAPPARFRILGARAHEELAAARRDHPDDHLLLAVLYARAGLEKEADAELRRVVSTDARVERLKSAR